jgi:hypothetical protein
VRLKTLLAAISAYFMGGWLYGLLAAQRVGRSGMLSERLSLALFCAMFFIAAGLLFWMASTAVKAAARLFRVPARSVPEAGFQRLFLRAFGQFSFFLALLYLLAELLVTLAFRQDQSRLSLALWVAAFLACGALLAWFFSRPLAYFLYKFSVRIQRMAGAAVLLMIMALSLIGGKEIASPQLMMPSIKSLPDFPSSRLLLVGIDAATWKVIDRLFEEGKLAVTKRLVDEGVRAELFSPPPQVSPAVWTTIVSGQPRQVHGVEQYLMMRLPGVRPFAFEALARDKILLGFFWVGLAGYLAGVVDGIPPTSDQVRAPRLWQLAGAAGLEVVLAGWPVTWPAQAAKGLTVSDGFGPGEFDVFLKSQRDESSLVFPKEELAWVRSFSIQPDPERLSLLGALSGMEPQELSQLKQYRYNRLLPPPAILLEKIAAADISRLHLVEKALGRFQPRLVLLTLNSADMAMHAFWPDRFPQDFGLERARHPAWGRLIDGAYELIDRGLGRLVAALPEPRVVLIVSDHGMSPQPGNFIWPGWHDERAVLVISGGPIRKGAMLERADYLDLLPTMLYLLGLEIPAGLPGRVLEEAIEPDFLARHPVRTSE